MLIATLASNWPLTACATPMAYSLDRSSSGYGEMLQARAECQRAGGEVVAPPAQNAGLKGYRCAFPLEPKAPACRQWRMYEAATPIGRETIHELGYACADER